MTLPFQKHGGRKTRPVVSLFFLSLSLSLLLVSVSIAFDANNGRNRTAPVTSRRSGRHDPVGPPFRGESLAGPTRNKGKTRNSASRHHHRPRTTTTTMTTPCVRDVDENPVQNSVHKAAVVSHQRNGRHKSGARCKPVCGTTDTKDHLLSENRVNRAEKVE